MTACRFEWDAVRPCGCTMPALNSRGEAFGYGYGCERCERFHWCVPAAEADGTTDSHLESVSACLVAMRAAGFRPNVWERPCPHLRWGGGGVEVGRAAADLVDLLRQGPPKA